MVRTNTDNVAGSGERLNVAMLASALSFAHPGPRPWPGALTSVEFARVVAREYERIAAPTTEAPPRNCERLIQALKTLSELEGMSFASDPKDRQVLAQSVVRRIALTALEEYNG